MTGMLASVAHLGEARLVAGLGVDIIDLKNPAAGALGALPLDEVVKIVRELGGQHALSATVGDLPMDPDVVLPAVEAMASTGVDYVKLGCFPGGDWAAVIAALQPMAARGVRLVAVLFGDAAPELSWLSELARAGFHGAMLDTADKRLGSLRQVAAPEFLRDFVAATREQGLLCGLAGSLRVEDVGPLRALGPDYLGFRGALCGGNRVENLDPGAVQALVAALRS